MTISYIQENGHKALLSYNVSRFKSYTPAPTGKYTNWNGSKCDVKYVEKPGWTEFKTFLAELPEDTQKLLWNKTTPRLYTFDIEVEIKEDEFPEPSEAKFPILTISIVNDNLDAVVLSTKELNDPDRLQSRYDEWLESIEFVQKLKLSKKPKATHIYFPTERAMIQYFFAKIVAKVPVMAGWNSLGFDWQYFQNRVRGYFPDIPFNSCSMTKSLSYKGIQDFKGNRIGLKTPDHTLVLDMMDIIGQFDIAVMPIKESLSLDYIASNTVGVGKIKYQGDLQKLYNEDYATYAFYNLIDSVLVQLIDKRFKTLSVLYAQSLVCKNRISTAFSKIAIGESMFFDYWYDHGIKVSPTDKFTGERGELVGAYVRQPIPGKHNFVCCCDFASLYPSTGRVTNISPENFIGGINTGEFTEDDLDQYRKDPNYFVSVNGNVYKNDRDYALKCIWTTLAKLRNQTKYLAKRINATVLSDIDHIKHGREFEGHIYDAEITDNIKREFGVELKTYKDLYNLPNLDEFTRRLKLSVEYMVFQEQAYKLISNSVYGSLSHQANHFFNIQLANDITGEGRNLIHIMEKHIPHFFQENWLKMTDLHKKIGIKLKSNI